MQALCDEVRYDGEGFRRQMRGRLAYRADIPTMAGEFRVSIVDEGAHGKHAPSIIAGCLPLVRAETSDQVIEVVPGLTEHIQQFLTETFSERDHSLRRRPRYLLPFLLRDDMEAAWLRATFRGRGIPPQSPRDTVRVVVCLEDTVRHDITDFPEGTGAGLGPGVRWQGGEVLLQPLAFGLEDGDQLLLVSP